ncbi:S-adenosylmethionine:tRNA-ribosyltransferase-isomerase [Moorella thermoacetica Y72]|uniref:S-adenosylmethionine:tRNA-ribosyltransferase-isomerase n=1 Tax=Moorella thermoacetica Y72 TaxID=1325331 RepID=A0A0S6UB70_NEOTH|nr:S-adenosylmethionine:tRNA-ribosyltransferase-isomerase [Moorella thermoacetica Y72]
MRTIFFSTSESWRGILILSLQVKIDANLKGAFGRKFQELGYTGTFFNGPDNIFQVPAVGANQGKPHVIVMFPEIVVGDAGEGIDHRCHFFQAAGWHLEGTEGAGIAQLAEFEDAAQAANNAVGFQLSNLPDNLVLAEAQAAPDLLVGPRHQGEFFLNEVEEPAVELVQQDSSTNDNTTDY